MSPWAERLVREIREVAPSLTREEIVRAVRRRVAREERAVRRGDAFVLESTFDGALIRMRNLARTGQSIEAAL